MDTATPHLFEYNAADGGKNAHYIARWISTTGEHGTWSVTVGV